MASTYTRKTYEMVAGIIFRHAGTPFQPDTVKSIAAEFADEFERDNPLFRREEFIKRCGYGDQPPY